MNRITLSISLLFILVLVLSMTTWFSEEAPLPPSEQEIAWQANYQASNMRSTLFNQHGQVNHKVSAAKMEHFELLGFTLFSQPHYIIYVEDQPYPWQITASEGTLYEDNRIQLETDVQIRSRNAEGFVQQITTSFIEINLTDKTMHSDQPVEISGPDYIIQSNGFVGNLANKQYELNNHVQTIYQPRS